MLNMQRNMLRIRNRPLRIIDIMHILRQRQIPTPVFISSLEEVGEGHGAGPVDGCWHIFTSKLRGGAFGSRGPSVLVDAVKL
jgi:hypothetical protein